MSFDINMDVRIFLSVVLGYLWMSKKDLGFDSIVVEDSGRYIHIRQNG